jgi:hypothetical protein
MILAGLLVAGCGAATQTAQTGASANAPDTCNAAAHQDLVGRDAAASLILPSSVATTTLSTPCTSHAARQLRSIKLREVPLAPLSNASGLAG